MPWNGGTNNLMKTNGSPTTFWTVIGFVVVSVASLLAMVQDHSSAPLPHSSAANEDDVVKLEVRLERVDTEVRGVQYTIKEIKEDVGALLVEQQQSTEVILQAIRGSRR